LLLSGVLVVGVGTFVGPSVARAAVATVEGVVTDTSGTPIAGATVMVQPEPNMSFGLTAMSGSDGHYAISGVFAGSWKVVASAPGHAVRFGNAATWDAGASIEVPMEGTIIFDVELPRTTSSISGVVTDPNGDPVPGVQVQASTPPGYGPGIIFPPPSGYFAQTITDADGHYALTGLAPTSFVVGFATQYFGDTGPTPPNPLVGESYLDAHDPTQATFVTTSEDALTGGIDAQLERGATLSGMVTDDEGDPMPNVHVYTTFNFDFGGVLTDDEGHYTLIGLPSGDTQLRASDEASGRSTFFRDPGAIDPANIHLDLDVDYTGFDIQFESTGIVFATVLDELGRPHQGAMVACREPGVPQVVDFPLPGWGDDIVCTSGAATPTAGPREAVTMPVGTYNAVGERGAKAFNTELTLSAQTTFTVTTDVPLDCTFVLEGPASCTSTDPETIDGDSIGAIVEDRAPNGGDGNLDGIRDATQSNVTSLPSYLDDGFVTLVVDPNLHITFASIADASGPYFMPETGSMTVRVEGLEPGGGTDLTILRTKSGPADELSSSEYTNGGPPTIGALPADFDGSTIVAHLVDGDGFDAPFDLFITNFVDGATTMSATPVVGDHVPPDITPPTIVCPSGPPQFLLNDPAASIDVAVSDDGAGVESPVLTVAVGSQFLGDHLAFVIASDRLGNTKFELCPYRVGVGIELVSPGAGDSLKAKAGKFVPIVWRATDFNGEPVTDDAHFVSITSSPASCPRGRELQAATSVASGPFQDDPGVWRYGFMAPSAKGCYLVRVDALGDSAIGLIRVH
jgi:protocatechuate 3,4-dioxygenase beta subunit